MAEVGNDVVADAPAATDDNMVNISATVDKGLLDALVELANRRGVNANTVLQQAILNEKFLSDQEAAGGSILLQRPDKSLYKLTLGQGASVKANVR